ncbi:MAG: hypothetical protein JWQ76_2830, partial [Ramlibacter sp.]|nr:hypothetical protein [Ramlibacter sp.]
IVAAALALDDALIDSARRDIVRLAGGDSGESLIMAEIEIGFGAVVGDVDLAMLITAAAAAVGVRAAAA